MGKIHISVLLLAASTLTASRGDDAAFQDPTSEADVASAAGKWDKADRLYEVAIKDAADRPALRAQAYMRRALNLKMWLDREPGNADMLRSQLMQSYETVIGINEARPEDRELACNNLAVLRLQVHGPDAAIATYRPFEGFVSPDAPIYYTNRGRILESAHKPYEALTKYMAALKVNPVLTRAAEGAGRALVDERFPDDQRLNAAQDLMQLLRPPFPKPPTPATGPIAYQFLRRWQDVQGPKSAKVDHCWLALISYYSRMPVDANQFRDKEWQEFQFRPPKAGPLKDVARWKSKIETLHDLYLEPQFTRQLPPVIASFSDARAVLRGWEAELDSDQVVRYDLARILKTAGDAFHRRALTRDRQEKPELAEDAYKRYMLAFTLDPSYADAALQAVSTMSDPRSPALPAGQLAEYAKKLFDEKSGLLVRAKTLNDFKSLLSLHIVLATLYELQNRWTEPYAECATFHWEQALKIESKVRELDSTQPPSPELQRRAAEAWRSAGPAGSERAAVHFVNAAEGFLNIGKPDVTLDLLKKIAELGSEPTEKQRRTLAEIRRLADKSKGIRPEKRLTLPEPLQALTLPPEPANTIIGGHAGHLFVWSFAPELPRQLPPVEGVPWRGQMLAPWTRGRIVSNPDDRLHIHDAEDLRLVATSPSHHPLVSKFAVASEGDTIATINSFGGVKIWDAYSHWHTLAGPDGKYDQVAVMPRGDRVILATGKTVTVWNVKGNDHERKVEGRSNVVSIAVAGDRKMFAVGYADGHAELRDSVSGNTIQTWDTGGGPVLELAFCVPSRCIATRGLDGAVRLWPFDRAEEIARLGHAIVPRQIAFTRDGRWLLVGVPQLDDSGEVEFWSMNELMPK